MGYTALEVLLVLTGSRTAARKKTKGMSGAPRQREMDREAPARTSGQRWPCPAA